MCIYICIHIYIYTYIYIYIETKERDCCMSLLLLLLSLLLLMKHNPGSSEVVTIDNKWNRVYLIRYYFNNIQIILPLLLISSWALVIAYRLPSCCLSIVYRLLLMPICSARMSMVPTLGPGPKSCWAKGKGPRRDQQQSQKVKNMSDMFFLLMRFESHRRSESNTIYQIW